MVDTGRRALCTMASDQFHWKIECRGANDIVTTASEGRQRKSPHGFALSEKENWFTSEIFHQVEFKRFNFGSLTPRIAGSSGTGGCGRLFSFGPSSILKSFTSLPRNTMYSYTLSDGGTSSSGRLPSVPNETTCSSATVEFSELISCRVPT